MTVSYQEAANVAVVLDYANTPIVVAGLNNISLPGSTRAEIEAKEFRQTSRKFAGSASRANMEFSGNAVFSDSGQKLLRTLYANNTKFGEVGCSNSGGEARIYINKSSSADHYLDSDFWAPDTASDIISQFQVGAYSYPSANIDGLFPFSSSIVCLGTVALFVAHITAETIAAVDSDPDTFTDSGSGFVAAGFEAGMVIIVEGDGDNNGIYGPLASVAAGTLTLATGDELAAEIAGDSVTIHGGWPS